MRGRKHSKFNLDNVNDLKDNHLPREEREFISGGNSPSNELKLSLKSLKPDRFSISGGIKPSRSLSSSLSSTSCEF